MLLLLLKCLRPMFIQFRLLLQQTSGMLLIATSIVNVNVVPVGLTRDVTCAMLRPLTNARGMKEPRNVPRCPRP